MSATLAFRCDVNTMASHGSIWAATSDAVDLDVTRRRIDDLVERWTRFDSDSELSRVSAAAWAGEAVDGIAVSADTFRWLLAAEAGWWMTGGLWDPTVRPAVEALGYFASRVDGRNSAPYGGSPEARPAPGLSELVLVPDSMTVSLPARCALDPGAMGKGLIADIAVELLVSRGASAAMVDLGGDISAGGRPVADFVVEVADPFYPVLDAPSVARLKLASGGVATSTTMARRFGPNHHVVDPRTGRPAATDLVSATVVAASCWEAEVWATAALVAGRTSAVELLTARGVRGVLVTAGGVVLTLGDVEPISERCSGQSFAGAVSETRS